MRWPADHPLNTDPALQQWSAGVDQVCPDGDHVTVLRHLPGRRVTSLVTTPSGPAVLKVFSGPRARGNDRRLAALAERPAVAAFLPRSLGVDSSGHVALLTYRPGRVLEELDDDTFVSTSGDVGRALRALHRCGARLDRAWAWTEEVAQLRRRATPRSCEACEEAIRTTSHLRTEAATVAHRDFHPRQVVLGEGGVAFIDLDDVAMAPAGLDVGNYLAHLRRDTAIGRRSPAASRAAADGFLAGYGAGGLDLGGWEQLALARLVGLAEARHGRPDWAAAIHLLLLDGDRHTPEPVKGRSGARGPRGRPACGRGHPDAGTRW